MPFRELHDLQAVPIASQTPTCRQQHWPASPPQLLGKREDGTIAGFSVASSLTAFLSHLSKYCPKDGQKSSSGHIQTFCVLNHVSKVKPKQEGLGICCSYSFANLGPRFEGCSGSSPREQVPQDILKIPCYITTFLRWTLRNPSIINITLMQKTLRHFQREKLNYVHYS